MSHSDIENLRRQLAIADTKITRLETDLRISSVIKEGLEVELSKCKEQLVKSQSRDIVYTQFGITFLHYIEYIEANTATPHTISTKFVRDHMKI